MIEENVVGTVELVAGAAEVSTAEVVGSKAKDGVYVPTLELLDGASGGAEEMIGVSVVDGELAIGSGDGMMDDEGSVTMLDDASGAAELMTGSGAAELIVGSGTAELVTGSETAELVTGSGVSL